MDKNEIWIINGIPGAGKSTTAQALAKTFKQSAYIEGDTLHEMVISGKVLPGQQPQEEEIYQIHLSVSNQCLLANSFSSAGYVPVIDYVIVNKERVEEYKHYLSGHFLYLVTLNPGPCIALERDAKRPEKTVAKQWVHLDEMIKNNLSDVGLWVDNSSLTIEQTVAKICQCKEQAKI